MTHGCFYKLGVFFLGVPIAGAPRFGVYIRAFMFGNSTRVWIRFVASLQQKMHSAQVLPGTTLTTGPQCLALKGLQLVVDKLD